MTWIIERTLSEVDVDEIVAIEAAAFSNPWTRPMYIRELQNPDVSFLYVLRMDNRIAGFCSFRNLPAPLIVPPVPTPQTRCVTRPSVWSQISGPVCS